MKTKNIFITGLLIIAGIAACKKDETTSTPTETTTRNDYVGSWECTEIPAAKDQYFDCTIYIDATTGSNIKIANFANLHDTAFAIVNGKSVILPKQTFSGNTFEGYGNFVNEDYLTWHYYVKDNTDSSAYNTSFNRK